MNQPYRVASSAGLVLTAFNGRLRALDGVTGSVRWEYAPGGFENPAFRASGSFVFVWAASELVALDLLQGAVRWRVTLEAQSLGNRGARIEVQGDTVLLSVQNVLVACSVHGGQVLWQTRATEWDVV